VVDLSSVGYLDSMALDRVVRLNKDFAARDAHVVWLVPPQTNARRIFRGGRARPLLRIAETLEGALQALTVS